jgi:hypothetical protein
MGKEGDPVRGSVLEFNGAVAQWRQAKERATSIQREFGAITSGGSVGLEGAAAEALRTLVADTAKVLNDVPQVFGAMEALLNDHLTKLKEYWAAADSALANAKVAQEARKVAAAASASSNARIASLKRQVEQLKAQPPEQSTSQLVVLNHQIAAEASTQRTKSGQAAAAQGTLAAELAKWDTLRAQEDQLNRLTAGKLDRFNLMSLRDPSWLEQQWAKVETFCTEFAHDVAGFVKNLMSGDWEQAMWHLRGVLDKLLQIVEIVVAVLIVVALVAAMVFATAISFGALLPALAAVAVLLASMKLCTGMYLVDHDSMNKETGQKLGTNDILFDALDVALAALTLVATPYKAFSVTTSNLAGYNAGRAFLKDQFGVVFKNGYNVSLKKTAIGGGKVILQGSPAVKLMSNHQGLLNDPGLRESVNGIGGTGSSDHRYSVIAADLSLVRSGQRGLSQPISTVVIPVTY